MINQVMISNNDQAEFWRVGKNISLVIHGDDQNPMVFIDNPEFIESLRQLFRRAEREGLFNGDEPKQREMTTEERSLILEGNHDPLDYIMK